MTSPDDLKALIWANVSELMRRKYGGDNLSRLGRDTGISNGGAQRLRDGASIGVELIYRVASHFEVHPWQLLAPGLGESMRLSRDELEAVRQMREPHQPAPWQGQNRRLSQVPTDHHRRAADHATRDPFNLADRVGAQRRKRGHE